jgi:hypothetical protein
VKNALRKHLLPWLVLWVYRLFFWSWRTTLDEPEELKQALASKSPIIFAHWHGHELAIVQTVRRYRLATMTSLSKDGQLIDFVIVKLGGATSKGSSSRGAVGALKGLVRLVILNRILDLRRNRTNLIVSHRVSTIRRADRIFVLDRGCLKEEGTHETLISLGGIYAALYEEQLLGEALENGGITAS